MRLEAGFVPLPTDEFLGATDAADQWRNASPAFSPGTGNTSSYWDTPVVHPGGTSRCSHRTPVQSQGRPRVRPR
jgi:hypothetical protein